MNTRFSPRPFHGLAFGVAALASAGAVALAGCGSLAASGSAASGTGSSAAPAAQVSGPGSPSAPAKVRGGVPAPALCVSANSVTRLVVLRSRLINRIQIMHFPFPPDVIVPNPAQARAVAAALCTLPKMPSGALNCPAEILGATYRLTFTVGSKPLPVVTVQATGCQAVTGLGPVRRVATKPAFWRVLGTAIGLYGAGPPVFRGNGPSLPQCQASAAQAQPAMGCPGTKRPLSSPGPVT